MKATRRFAGVLALVLLASANPPETGPLWPYAVFVLVMLALLFSAAFTYVEE